MESIEKSFENGSWENILKSIKENKFNEQYTSYECQTVEHGFLIENKQSKENFFLFEIKRNIKIYINNQILSKEIYSSLEIENFVKSKNFNINDLFIKDTNEKYISCKNYLGLFLANNELEIKNKNKLPNIQLKNLLYMDNDYKPEEYSDYFYEYFIYEDKQQKSEKFLYSKSAIRDLIQKNIISLMSKTNLKKYKLTGPTSIGKSFTLFRISRALFNCIYINLKVLNNYREDTYLCYSIIISELERLNFIENDEYSSELITIITDNYEKDIFYLNLLLKIMEYLNKLNDRTFIFIFDQFKKKYLINGFLEKIEEFENIKYVLCSSINDKDLREECLKTWTIKGKNFLILTEEIQDYYLYYSTLYIYYNDNETNDFFKKMGNLPKYKLMYKENSDKNILLKKIKTDVVAKIEEFCENNKIRKNEILIHLKFILNKEYPHEKLETIIKYVPLKYFFRTELTEKECDDYFKNEEYKYNTIESESVKGYYFEEAVKFGLKKIIKYDKIITLNEIVSMEKIIDKDNEIMEQEEYSKFYLDIQKLLEYKAEEEIAIKNDNNNIIQENKNDKKSKENEEKKKKEEKEEAKENEEIEECEDNNLIEKKKSEKEEKKENEEKEENKEFNEILEKFKVKKIKDININEKCLTENILLLSKNIEDYRKEEIKKQKKECKNIEKCNFTGKELLLLDQIHKTGKTLDYAYLSGEQINKNFFGFQMKCYFENSELNKNTIDKAKIKEKCQQILVNSMKLFNCKIIKWYYILIFYYNSRNLKENISMKNIKKCIARGIAFIFYDPVVKVFYDSDRKTILTEITSSELSDLDNYETNKIKTSIDNDKIYNKNIRVNKRQLVDFENQFIKDLSNMTPEKDKIESQLDEILKNIQEKIGLKNILKFHFRFPISKERIETPNNDNIYLYKQKSKKCFIALVRIKNELKFFDLSENNKEIDSFYGLFDEHFEYYYVLGIVKKRKLKSKDKSSPLKIEKEKIYNESY